MVERVAEKGNGSRKDSHASVAHIQHKWLECRGP